MESRAATEAGRFRVVLAEDNYLMREAICDVLETGDDVQLVGVAHDYAALMNLVEREQPDVVVTDIRMPPTNTDEGIRAADELRDTHPKLGVVVLSQYAEPPYTLRLFDRGVERRAYLLKEHVATRADLLDAIRAVAEGGSRIDPYVVEILVAERAHRESSLIGRLTQRELEVLAEVAQGKSNTAIAAALFLTKRGVEKHINSIFAKLELGDERTLSRRVAATLVFLSEQGDGAAAGDTAAVR